jgi:hypothetical protein
MTIAAEHGPTDSISRPRGGPVVRSLMSSRTHSSANRRLAKDIVWRWVASRWPFLMPTAAVMERSHIESALPGRTLSVATSEDGAVWTLTVSIRERETAPTWTTRAIVADTGSSDVVAVETSCSDIAAARVVAPPAVLGAWVERLALEDGGIPVQGQPRIVQDEADAQRLLEHVTHPNRALPVLLLAAKGDSKYYGVDPRVLAEAVSGLAHVACLAAPALRAWTELCGRALTPVPGAVRIYLPGFALGAQDAEHPKSIPVRPHPMAADEGRNPATDFRRRLRQQLCSLSVMGTFGGPQPGPPAAA